MNDKVFLIEWFWFFGLLLVAILTFISRLFSLLLTQVHTHREAAKIVFFSVAQPLRRSPSSLVARQFFLELQRKSFFLSGQALTLYFFAASPTGTIRRGLHGTVSSPGIQLTLSFFLFRSLWPIRSIYWCRGSVQLYNYCSLWTILDRSVTRSDRP